MASKLYINTVFQRLQFIRDKANLIETMNRDKEKYKRKQRKIHSILNNLAQI